MTSGSHLAPDAHYDRYYQQLQEPIPRMDGGKLRRDLLMHDGAGPKHDGESDPQRESELHPPRPVRDLDQIGKSGYDRGNNEALNEFNGHLPCGRPRLGCSFGVGGMELRELVLNAMYHTALTTNTATAATTMAKTFTSFIKSSF